MGAYDLENFTDYMTLALGQRTDLEAVSLSDAGSTDMYVKWVNAAYIQLVTNSQFFGEKASLKFPELEVVDTSISTVDGTSYITVPTDLLITRHLWNATSDESLDWIPWRDYLNKTGRETASSEGKPQKWTRTAGGASSGSRFHLSPRPDAAYNIYIYYRKRPAVLATTNTTLIGAEWDEPILYFATYKALIAINHFDKAQVYKEEFLNMIRGLEGVYDPEEKARDAQAYPDTIFLKHRYNA